MPGHSVKISIETYALVVLAAAAAEQSLTQWMETAAKVALARQDHAQRVARFRQAEIQAAERLEGAPLARDYGLTVPRF